MISVLSGAYYLFLLLYLSLSFFSFSLFPSLSFFLPCPWLCSSGSFTEASFFLYIHKRAQMRTRRSSRFISLLTLAPVRSSQRNEPNQRRSFTAPTPGFEIPPPFSFPRVPKLKRTNRKHMKLTLATYTHTQIDEPKKQRTQSHRKKRTVFIQGRIYRELIEY